MTDHKSSSVLCRMCGEEFDSLRNIFEETQLAEKIRLCFSIVIFEADTLPQGICDSCIADVNTFHEKLLRYNKFERQWANELKAQNPNHPYVKASKLFQEHRAQTLGIISDLTNEGIDCHSNASSDNSSILKNILLNRHIYEVKSLQQVCLDFFNKNGPTLLDTVLYVRETIGSPVPSEADSSLPLADDQASICTADETSLAEDGPAERGPSPKTVTKKKKNPVKDYVYKRRRKVRNFKVRLENGTFAKENRLKNTLSAEADTESQDSFRSSASKLRHSRLEQKPSRSSERITKAAVKVDGDDKDKSNTDKDKAKVDKDKSKTDKDKTKTDKDKAKIDKDKSKDDHLRLPKVQPPIGIKLKRNPDGTFKKPTVTEGNATARPRQRSTTRINYSEALVDEALMYEEILLNKEAKEQISISNTMQQSKLEQSRVPTESKPPTKIRKSESTSQWSLEEIVPVVKTKPGGHLIKSKPSWSLEQIANRELSIEQISTAKKPVPVEDKPSISIRAGSGSNTKSFSLTDIKNKLKINPDSVLSISSAVSITLKSPKQEKSEAKPIFNIKTNPGIDKPADCKYCDKKCANLKELAVHQMQHLRLATHRVGSQQILNPKLRRGRMVPIGQQKFFRCLNCWRLHPNSQSILEHWVSGKCLFYCSICGKTFHDNPKLIREHFMAAHRIRYKVPEQGPPVLARPGPPQQLPNKALSKPPSNKPVPQHVIHRQLNNLISSNNRIPAKVQKSGRVTCEICSCSFPNMHSRNSHMRLHKNEMMAAELKQKGSKDSPYYQLDFKVKSPVPEPNRQRISHLNNNRLMASASRPNGEQHMKGQGSRPNQLQQLLQQKPRAFNFPPGHQSKSREVSATQSKAAAMFDEAIRVKDEPVDADVDEQFDDFINAAMSSADTEYVDTDYASLMTPLQDLMESPESIVKSEPGAEAPRIQIKKLHELQSPPGYEPPIADNSTYYSSPPQQQPQHSMPIHHQPQPGPSYMHMHQDMQPPGPSIQMHPPPPATHQMIGQSQQMQQFQISQVQQMQNSQYYNPVFVVQQPSAVPSHPPAPAQHVQQSMQGEMMYQQYGNDPYTDYSKYYS